MGIAAEICLYLLVVLGIVCATIAACSSDNIHPCYVRKKEQNSNVSLEIKFTCVNDDEIQDTSYALANGEFDSIYDLVDEFKVYKKDD